MRQYRAIALSALLLLTLANSGCAQTKPANQGTAAKAETIKQGKPSMSETIYGFDVTATSIKFKVKSTGCTKPADFELQLDEGKDGLPSITIVRNRQDMCRALPRLYPVELPLPEELLGAQSINIANPIGLESDFSGKGKPVRQYKK